MTTLPLLLFALAPIQAPRAVLLDVPAMKQQPGSPKEGWCGEASIQMIGLYHGLYAPQATINRLGRPKTPDLRTAADLATALGALGLRFTPYPTDAPNLPAFVRAVEGELDRGVPVLVGMKIYPSAHPDWPLDHVCVARGYSSGSMAINDTWAFAPDHASWERLGGTRKGISFVNAQRRFVAFAVEPAPGEGQPVRLTPDDTAAFYRADKVPLTAHLAGLETAKTYEIVRFSLPNGKATVVATIHPTATKTETSVAAPRGEISLFRVRPAPSVPLSPPWERGRGEGRRGAFTPAPVPALRRGGGSRRDA